MAVLKLLRNQIPYENRELALQAITDKAQELSDGEMWIASYAIEDHMGQEDEEIAVKSILAIKRDTGVTIFDTEDIKSIIKSLDAFFVGNDNKVITNIAEEDGLIEPTFTNITSVKLAGYAVGNDESDKVASTDTLGEALGKLQGQINGMDLPNQETVGSVVTFVSQTDGKVSASNEAVCNLELGDYVKKDLLIGYIGPSDTITNALSKLENRAITSIDKTVSPTRVRNNNYDLSVNIDNTTLVKDSNGVISTDLKIQAIEQAPGSTYASQYQLVYGESNTPIGSVINVAKDQFLKEASFDAATQKLTLVMYTSTGATTNVEVDFGSVVIESEAGDGLYVKPDHSMNIGVDANSESVTVSDGNGGSTTAAVLSVGADALKVDNIQSAIDYASSVINKTIEDNERTISSALNDLNGRITDLDTFNCGEY